MNSLLMNPWTITIIGGLVVGVVVYVITKGIAARGKVTSSDGTDGKGRNYLIDVRKKGRIKAGGGVQAGDKGILAAYW